MFLFHTSLFMITHPLSFETLGFFESIFLNSRLYSLIITDLQGNILAFNDTFQREFGYKKSTLTGKNFSSLFIKDDRAKGLPEKELRTVEEEGAALDKNYLLHADGYPLWVAGETIAVENTEGEQFYVKAVHNLNKEKLLEQRLQASNNLLDNILQTISDALIVIDEQERILKVNSSFAELFEKQDYVYENSFLSDLPIEFWQKEELKQSLRKIFKEHRLPEQTYFAVKRKNGKKRIIRFESFFLEEHVFARPTLLIILKDETQKKIMARHYKDTIGFIAHEIKNPLTRLNLSIALLNKALIVQDISAAAGYTKTLEETGRHLNMLMRELTDVASAGLHKLPVNTMLVTYGEVIEECIERIQLTFPCLTIKYSCNTDVKLRIDRQRICQVMENLLTNAVKYAGTDKPVEVTIERLDGHVKTTVTDYGPGIKVEDLPHVFKRFYRAEERKVHGLGLGLYLCKAIIKAHRGEIDVNSIYGTGSSFYFTLPAMS